MDLKTVIALLGFLAILGDSHPQGRKSDKFKSLEIGCYTQIPIQNAKRTRSDVNIWPGATVPYELNISANWSLEDASIILDGMKLISEKTCIQFRPRNRTDRSYVSFVNDPEQGCSSSVGKAEGNQPQDINLSNGCVDAETVAHEVMHALGFHHEHVRPDRDDFIKILWQNINETAYSQFHRNLKMKTYGIHYDFDSIMHYDAYGFSIPNVDGERKPTMKSIVEYAEVPQTDIKDLSIRDVMKLHALYGRHCKRKP